MTFLNTQTGVVHWDFVRLLPSPPHNPKFNSYTHIDVSEHTPALYPLPCLGVPGSIHADEVDQLSTLADA
jgi:hypothetical protein